MQKVSFQFPNYQSLWLFKERTRAINVRVEPKNNRITGLFGQDEIDMAVKEFNAEPWAPTQPENIQA